MESIGECPICFERLKTQFTLVCKHTFCYLCIKTTLKFGNYKCPVCRADVSQSVLENAMAPLSLYECSKTPDTWFYSGRKGGWWEYSEEHMIIIEKAWNEYKNSNGTSQISINICSTDYIIDFISMTQVNTSIFGIRKIKRDSVIEPQKKGIAGLCYIDEESIQHETVTYSNDVSAFNPHYSDSYLG